MQENENEMENMVAQEVAQEVDWHALLEERTAAREKRELMAQHLMKQAAIGDIITAYFDHTKEEVVGRLVSLTYRPGKGNSPLAQVERVPGRPWIPESEHVSRDSERRSFSLHYLTGVEKSRHVRACYHGNPHYRERLHHQQYRRRLAKLDGKSSDWRSGRPWTEWPSYWPLTDLSLRGMLVGTFREVLYSIIERQPSWTVQPQGVSFARAAALWRKDGYPGLVAEGPAAARWGCDPWPGNRMFVLRVIKAWIHRNLNRMTASLKEVEAQVLAQEREDSEDYERDMMYEHGETPPPRDREPTNPIELQAMVDCLIITERRRDEGVEKWNAWNGRRLAKEAEKEAWRNMTDEERQAALEAMGARQKEGSCFDDDMDDPSFDHVGGRADESVQHTIEELEWQHRHGHLTDDEFQALRAEREAALQEEKDLDYTDSPVVDTRAAVEVQSGGEITMPTNPEDLSFSQFRELEGYNMDVSTTSEPMTINELMQRMEEKDRREAEKTQAQPVDLPPQDSDL